MYKISFKENSPIGEPLGEDRSVVAHILIQLRDFFSAANLYFLNVQKKLDDFSSSFYHLSNQGKRGNLSKSGVRFSLNASRPSFASSVV